MIPVATIDHAYAECARITRRHGPNFAVTFEVLPEVKRRAIHASYAFCRLADDLADEPQADPDAMLRAWRAELAAAYRGEARHPVGVALTDAVGRFPIARRAFDDLIRGCEQDLVFRPPSDLAALRRYYDLVATPIGEISLAVFGGATARSARLARHLAHALQWTNVLRDVHEDALRGRRYLPGDWCRAEGVGDDLLAAPRDAVVRVLRRGIDVARAHYDAARSLPDLVESDARSTVRLMIRIYGEVLERIAADPARVLHERVALTDAEKQTLVRVETGVA